MEIRKHSNEKVDEYFERLRGAGVETGDTHQRITRAEVDIVLEELGFVHRDIREVVWCLLDSEFPSLFPGATGLGLSSGASTAHIGGYVGRLFP